VGRELVDCKGCQHLGRRDWTPYCNFWGRGVNPSEMKFCSAKKIKMYKCSICKNLFHLHELFCLNSCRGANSLCRDCVLVCESCLKQIKKCLDNLEVGE